MFKAQVAWTTKGTITDGLKTITETEGLPQELVRHRIAGSRIVTPLDKNHAFQIMGMGMLAFEEAAVPGPGDN